MGKRGGGSPGIAAIAVGVRWTIKREVAIGIEGRVPAFALRGAPAVLLGMMAILIGAYILWNPGVLP